MIRSLLIALCFVFCCSPCNAADIVGYQYWFDGDYAQATAMSIAPESDFNLISNFSTTGLSEGIHWLFIRFEDDQGLWSPAMSRMFLIPPSQTSGNLQSLEYWFNEDIANSQTLPLSAITENWNGIVDAQSLSLGFHKFSIRFTDSFGRTSPPFSKIFYNHGNTENNEIVAYRYWFNDDMGLIYDETAGIPSDPYELISDLNTGVLPQGLGHNIKIQFQNSESYWSPILSANFNKIIGCWGDFNGDNEINTLDLLVVLAGFGCISSCSLGDINFDGQVNTMDLLILLSLFQEGC